MKKFRSFIAAVFLGFATPALMTACGTNTVQQAPTFNQTLAQGFLTVEVVSDLVSDLVVRDRISVEKAEEIEAQLTKALNTLIDIRAVGESFDSNNKLESVTKLLRSLETQLQAEANK